MRHIGKVTLLVLLAQVNQVSAVATPYYRIRSQSTDAAREMVGVMDKIHLYRDDCKNYGIYDVTFEYTRTFQSDKLANVLFGQGCLTSCKCPTIKISGSQVANRTKRDWLADYFYLPPDFESTITFTPRVENFIIDFDAYWGLEEWCHGTYFRVHAPAVHTRWNLNFCEFVNNEGVCGYDTGYFNNFAIERFELLDAFTQYVSDMESPQPNRAQLTSTVQNFFSTVNKPLASSKWAKCGNTLDETRLAEIQFILGKDFFPCDDESVRYGFNLRAAAPTGNRPEGIYLFEPIVGNSHQWEFGGGFTGHWTLYDCEETRLRFYLTANITHLFSDQQYRTFDLKNGCNSRYMLAMALKGPGTLRYGPLDPGTDEVAPLIDTTVSPNESAFQYTPVANLSRSLVDVSVDVKGDLVAMFNYVACNWTYDLGYNFWGRSCETIRLSKKCPHLLVNNRKWVLKGESRVVGCQNLPENQFVFNVLAPSQSGATIHGGANVDNAQGAYIVNPNDNTQGLVLSASDCVLADFDCSIFGSGDEVVAITSADPVFLNERDLDIEGARTRGLSHKIFAHINHNFEPNDCDRTLFIGVGGKAEFGNNRAHSNNDCLTGCVSDTSTGCTRCALSEWGIWFKGGIAY